jgi:hypothetical protein
VREALKVLPALLIGIGDVVLLPEGVLKSATALLGRHEPAMASALAAEYRMT